MKKALWIVAAATLFFSCQKEQEAVTPDAKSFTFKASIEKLAADTKADMDSEYGLMWAEGDKIGIGVSGWDNNQPFVLQSVSGDDYGSFEWEYYPGEAGDIDKIKADAYAAFFPWQGAGSDVNNVYEDVVYFKMPSYYEHYTSGQMLTPLVAPVTSGEIDFMHAGAAVQVTITNLPAGSHSIAMAADQQIFGDYHIAVSDAGDAAMALDGEAQTTYNSIWLNYDAASEEREFTFLFPTPPMTTPKLSFIIYDENGIMVWNKNLKAQTVSPGRGQVLVMPELTIEPYEQFTNVSAEWTVIGTANGSGWDEDFPMVTDGTICIAKGLYFAEDGSFKVRKNGSWDESYPTAGNWNIWEGEGLYDVIFNTSTKELKAVKSNCPYPTAEYAETHHCSSITNAKDLGKTETANCYVITKAGSYKIPCVKGNSNESAGNRASVQLLWETYNNNQNVTANSIIAAVDYDYRDNYVYFKTPETLQPGNALIAALDADGNIIWSWHIWIPETAVADIADYNFYNRKVMDRNLGALQAVAKDQESPLALSTYGLYYQWGRKDPMFTSNWGRNASLDISYQGYSGAGVSVTTEESIKNPTTFYYDGSDNPKYSYWNSDDLHDLWNANQKTIYDPCPAGYRVPKYNDSFAMWHYNMADGWTSDATNGWFKYGDITFPYSGYASGETLNYSGQRTVIWSSDYKDAERAYAAYIRYDKDPIYNYNSYYKAYLASVRCCMIDGEVLPPADPDPTNFGINWSEITTGIDYRTILSSSPYYVFKVTYDDNYVYFYSKRNYRNDYWGNYGYFYYGVDTDNDENTAVSDPKGMTGADEWLYVYPFGGTNDSPAINSTLVGGPGKSGISADWDDSAYACSGVIGETYVTVEIRFARSFLGITGGTGGKTYKFHSWGNKSADSSTIKEASVELTVN